MQAEVRWNPLPGTAPDARFNFLFVIWGCARKRVPAHFCLHWWDIAGRQSFYILASHSTRMRTRAGIVNAVVAGNELLSAAAAKARQLAENLHQRCARQKLCSNAGQPRLSQMLWRRKPSNLPLFCKAGSQGSHDGLQCSGAKADFHILRGVRRRSADEFVAPAVLLHLGLKPTLQ